MSLKEQIKHEIEQLVDPSTNKTLVTKQPSPLSC